MALDGRQQWQPQAILVFTGLALIVIGVVAIGVQLGVELLGHAAAVPPAQPLSQHLTVSPNQLEAATRFVGLELVLVGALLQIVGCLSAKPWKADAPVPDKAPG